MLASFARWLEVPKHLLLVRMQLSKLLRFAGCQHYHTGILFQLTIECMSVLYLCASTLSILYITCFLFDNYNLFSFLLSSIFESILTLL